MVLLFNFYMKKILTKEIISQLLLMEGMANIKHILTVVKTA